MANYISTLTGVQMDEALADMATHNSEAWAVGTRAGVPVSEGDVTYQNNAKYYAGDLSYSINKWNAYDYLPSFASYNNANSNGIAFAWNADNTVVTVSGTATATAFCNIYFGRTSPLPDVIVAGKTYFFMSNSSSPDNVYTRVFFYDSSNTLITSNFITEDRSVTIPSETYGMVIRIEVPNGATVNATVRDFAVLSNPPSQYVYDHALILNRRVSLDNGTDLNSITSGNNGYMISSSYTYYNLPVGMSSGLLLTYDVRNFLYQYMYAHGASLAKKRYYSKSNSSWSEWVDFGGGITQVINQYENTNTYNVSPSITTDTNNYLASTGDTTDVTGSILAMLNSTGCCHLGAGVFWVSGVDMPDDTEIIGSGASTKVYLLGSDSTTGYAIKMGSRCTVSNMSILGNTTNYTASADVYPSDGTYTERHGILWQGDASTSGTHIPRRGQITNCYIANFTGGAITCYDTGGGVVTGLAVSDCTIWHCYAGVNVYYNSEFNKWNNIMANNCYIGSVNNGGNNIFSNCDFSKNRIGMLIDNRNSQSPNNSHGSVTNCVFNHTADTGNGIEIRKASYGEMFVGCQLFYSSIYIADSNGIAFTNLNAGQGESITVSGGGLVMFNGCVFRTAPTIAVTNNTTTHFTGCYTYNGTVVTA